jgi:hypothetical protein
MARAHGAGGFAFYRCFRKRPGDPITGGTDSAVGEGDYSTWISPIRITLQWSWSISLDGDTQILRREASCTGPDWLKGFMHVR